MVLRKLASGKRCGVTRRWTSPPPYLLRSSRPDQLARDPFQPTLSTLPGTTETKYELPGSQGISLKLNCIPCTHTPSPPLPIQHNRTYLTPRSRLGHICTYTCIHTYTRNPSTPTHAHMYMHTTHSLTHTLTQVQRTARVAVAKSSPPPAPATSSSSCWTA